MPCSTRSTRQATAATRIVLRDSSSSHFSSALSKDDLERALAADLPETRRDCGSFPSDVALFAFLTQTLHDDPSCRAAVARISADRMAKGLVPCAAHNSSYCKAREKLPVALLEKLCRHCGAALEELTPKKWRWHGRTVKIIDGTSVACPDTPVNRDAFPQHHAQAPGLGLPAIRIVAMTSLATGALVDAAFGRAYGDGKGEMAYARDLLRSVSPDDVVVADRYFCAYYFIAPLLQTGADFVGRLGNGRRKADFRRGVRLGPKDHVIEIEKSKRGVGISADAAGNLPETLRLREVEVVVKTPTGRRKKFVIVTSLLSAEDFPREDLADLYRQRWQMELDLRSIKQVMHMDLLRCRTPAMLAKEIWAHLLAYNLIRKLMADAGFRHGIPPRELSFKATVQITKAVMPHWTHASRQTRRAWYGEMLASIASQRLPKRPGRVEPRQIKRQPKKFVMLEKPRTRATELARASS